MSYQECVNKNSEHEGDSPLTMVYRKQKIKNMFEGYNAYNLERYGGYWVLDRHFPSWISKIAKKINLEKWFGSNWIIKAKK